MPNGDLTAIASEYIDAFNAADWARVRSVLTSGTVYDEKATHRRIAGVDDVITAEQAWRETFPDIVGTIMHSSESGNSVALEVAWEGTQTGPLEMPTGTIPPSGNVMKLPGAFMLIFDGDKIQESRHYFDLMTMLQQIGALPPPA